MMPYNTESMTKTNYAMFTPEGNAEVARLAELMLEQHLIVADNISQIVHAWERFVQSEHPEFCKAHGEYSDTAVREELFVFFEKRLGERKYTNIGTGTQAKPLPMPAVY